MATATKFEFGRAQLFIAGRWVDAGPALDVRNKYSGEIIGTVPLAQKEDVDAAIGAACEAAPKMAAMPGYRKSEILARAAQLMRERLESIARTIAAEAGKALKFARIEVDRAIGTFTIAAEEARRIHGETVPLDALPAGEGYFGFWLRRPVGVVAAIAPFNFPLNLVAHKVAPALAAGNAVVLKPASTTPLTAVLLCRILEEAGLPAGAINLVVGSGRTVGEWLVADPRVAKVTFTGSPPVGEQIIRTAGIKKVTLELGNTSPVIVAPDADLELVAKRCAIGAFYNSGQVCLSVQRVYSDRTVSDPFTQFFQQASEGMVVGDPLDERVDVGPMIDEHEAERIEAWVTEAQKEGAHVVTGGRRQGPIYWPTVLTGVTSQMKVVREEAFAPIASVIPFGDFEEALEQADATDYGLQASVFTRDIDRVFQAIRRLNFGGVIVNDTPTFRVDHMPYGGTRRSGIGREGVRFAIEEMTSIQMVAIRLSR
ncbi:MAG: aldehyde dehydrogenase family protein [Acidobacteria bacterium]|nr:aldehyde dehydrogenase family protein [Acidobacteriota bacterium]